MPPRRALPVLTSTGDPAHVGIEANVRRALDQVYGQLEGTDGAAVPYAPASSTDWSGNPPATVADALDRIAAALGPIA